MKPFAFQAIAWGFILFLLAGCSAAPVAASLAGSALQTDTQAHTVALAAADSPEGLADLQSTFEAIYATVNPSVVNIEVSSGVSGLDSSSGSGSGFVWDREGHIVTNAHVVADANEFRVTFSDGTMVPAELVGADLYSDLAVLHVDVPVGELSPVTLADSNQIQVGQIAIAIGNPFGLQGTMTQGIISGLARTLGVDAASAFSAAGGSYSIPDIIQTDASINPGNSGGVLVDGAGEVIGVTTAIASTTGSNSGVGFVIPSAIVAKFVPELIADGEVTHSWMGISGISLTPDLATEVGLDAGQRGALVLSVVSSGPAEAAGVQGRTLTTRGQAAVSGGDVIIAIDGRAVDGFEDLVSYLYNATEPNQEVTLTVLRGGQERDVKLTLGTLPAQG